MDEKKLKHWQNPFGFLKNTYTFAAALKESDLQ
jgi:hypothetical protein